MAQFETTGGGFIQNGNRKSNRKVYVSTSGSITVPSELNGRPLTDFTVTDEAGGITRGVAEYTEGVPGTGGITTYGSNRKRVELIGGTREVPIYNHPKFSGLTTQQIQEVQEAAEQGSSAVLTAFNATQEILYGFLSRKVEYFLAPAVVGRISEIESRLPRLDQIAKVANPSELEALDETYWICTSISAAPVGNDFEVTREYTLTFAGWADVQELYNWDQLEEEEE
jgi:hypothetical protein